MAALGASGDTPLPEENAPEQTAQAGQEPQWIWLARLRRPQGRKGEVFADILTDFPEKFAERRRLWLVPENGPNAPREVTLANHWLHKGGIVLHFAGIDSISAAETLAGLIVAIPRTERAPLADGETYIGDLIGCALVDVAGATQRVVGTIEDVDRSAGPVALLVVRAPGSADEILVPFAKSYLRTIDLAAKRVEMALPEGLIDLNSPGKG
ncbi:MAG TPA: ribosome maturation factor RimM [Terracidiphilus sp.]|jgi:16S rRNA processing protein RimM|nr:ribosome maturation factor RimM [Terracidiphilus sp.]HUX28557.1 ribosome maturation factor RimM [Terracidiphilus sp.]